MMKAIASTPSAGVWKVKVEIGAVEIHLPVDDMDHAFRIVRAIESKTQKDSLS